MSIKLAQEFDFDIVKKITHKTIKEIYPHYYPNGAVVFFLAFVNKKLSHLANKKVSQL